MRERRRHTWEICILVLKIDRYETELATNDYTSFQSGESWTYQEMRQKPIPRDAFFNLRQGPQQQFRPTSVATEFVDTDWDGEDIESEEEEEENSPRASVQSAGQPSFTTISSYDEAPTPRSSRGQEMYIEDYMRQVEGPRGPHLFRSSTDPCLMHHEDDEDVILTLSPITPKVNRGITEILAQPQFPRRSSPFQYTDDELDTSVLALWTPEMVAQWMLNAGIDPAVTKQFVENDISGEILLTMKSDDLRQIGIQSFGIRTKVWSQLQPLMNNLPASPRPETPIEDAPSREARRELKKEGSCSAGRQNSRRQRRRPSGNDIITPMESVSIIGIEQVIPKAHNCSKGENCSKWKKQQRIMDDFKTANPHIDMDASGTVMIYGDVGNPDTARALDPNEIPRPFSDAVPSVVASSDVMGPGGLPPLQYLQEAALRNFQARDPQESVRQFLDFHNRNSDEIPPTPPFEVTPAAQPPHQGLRHLPKLSIPGAPQVARPAPPRTATVPPAKPLFQQHQRHRSSPLQHEFVPYRMDKADPLSPDLEPTKNPYRFGTPFSELDVPVTAVPLGPVARDVSQSVPPDMNYRVSPINNSHRRSQSRASGRRPSFPVLPALDENQPASISPRSISPRTSSPKIPARPQPLQVPTQAPPRFNYPWSPERPTFEQAIAPMSTFQSGNSKEAPAAANGVSFQGPMKKRKTRMLRHEWQDGYFTLKGTRLNMHKDSQQMDRTLEYVDIDDYAIACSSAASTSKLSAAFKAVSISHDRKKSDPVGAFSFQLIPQDKNTARLRKRESSLSGQGGAAAPAEALNGTGKTHHFAVKSRDDRIDWMRELMLAKALKQKGEGFEISVNGNMI
ncbi:hypothetical protein PT974_08718 [Cladobotryum mycophilum]|uniref:SAM and PH domain-containing protein n=1 Tax=Cladobotryum mycophilum TaxID=491253 RepID=A0ABR0SF63_9HYPO